MLWSGSSPLTVVRRNMWGFLLFAGVAWLAVGWSVLRLEPADVVRVAGPVVLFGALTEAVRALAGTRTWWLNAGLAVLFTATGLILLADRDSTYTTPAALLGWYLIVRGAADIAVSMLNRETDRVWGLLMVVGVAEAGLGFYTTGPWGRSGELLVAVLGALGVLRGIADLVAALRLREVTAFRAEILDLPPERAAGVAGYTAGLTDFEAAPARGRPRHRATSRSAAASVTPAGETPAGGTGGDRFHDEVVRTTADLDAMLAQAGVTGAAVAPPEPHDLPEVPDTAEGAELQDQAAGSAQPDHPAGKPDKPQN